MVETRDRTSAPNKAGQKPSISKPETSQAARASMIAFTTKAKSPIVRIVRGRAIS